MKFVLVDRIIELEPGRRIVAQKAVSLAEEYLADHFPTFPVLPGVLMLEAFVQSAAWLVRATLDFAPSLVLLKEARNITYKSFVAPGGVLTITAECDALDAAQSSFSGRGELDGREILKGRLTLRHLTLAETDPASAELDARLRARQRELFKLLWKTPATAPAAGVPVHG
ncbi:MAG: 3-hydroxyacyl-ACP dehydratase FabZ family protein [Planctomycetota bacterium]